MATIKKLKTATGIIIKFPHGEVLQCNINDLPQEMRDALAIHGLTQKVGDSYSGAHGDSPLALQIASGVWNALCNGNWSVRSEGEPRISYLAQALSNVTGQSLENVLAKLADMTDAERKAMEKRRKVKAEMLRLKAEAAKARAEAAMTEDDDEDEEIDF